MSKIDEQNARDLVKLALKMDRLSAILAMAEEGLAVIHFDNAAQRQTIIEFFEKVWPGDSQKYAV